MLDRTDARLLLALRDMPRASGVQLASMLRLARNTVQSRLARWYDKGLIGPVDRLVDPRDLGYPLRAFVTAILDQHRLDTVIAELKDIPEVLQVAGISGAADLVLEVTARDADDLYRIAGLLLDIPGVRRTNMAIVMHEALPYRTAPLLERVAAGG